MALPVISLEEAQVLEEEQIILSGLTNGKRKVSAALLSPPSSQGSLSSSTSSASASVRIRSFNPSTKASFDLPEDPDSVAALEFLGFTRKKAGDIFENWAHRMDPPYPPQNPDGLLEYALADLGRLHIQPLKDLPPTQAMAGLGISDELQAALTDPRFSQLFRSETLRYWLADTMQIRYSTLVKLIDRLKSRAVRTIAKRKEKKRPKIAGVFESGASSSSTQQPLTTSASSNIESEGKSLPGTYIAVQARPIALPDHYILYKGKAVGNMNEEMFVLEDGSINMNPIRTPGGGDFNPDRDAWYWTKEEATAEQYREWGERRCKWSETWIIQIQVPKTFIDTLRKQQLWYSPDWKEYIWYCRKNGSAGPVPAKFDKLYEAGQAQLVEGHVCGRAPNVIPKIKKEEVQEKMSENDVLYSEGRKATQLAIMDLEVAKRLGMVIRGKIHIEIYPAVALSK